MSTREVYIEKLKAKLDELDANIRGASAEAKVKYENQIHDLQKKRDELQQSIKDIQEAGEDAWEELKQGANDAWDALKDSLSKAKSEFERGYKETSKK
jgi:hypothetical protein